MNANNIPAGWRDARDAWVNEIVRNVAELGDRTSPDEWPEAMLVTAEELTVILESALATHPLAAAVLQQEAGEPVAEIRGGCLNWHIPSHDYKVPQHFLVGLHKLYTTPQVSPPQARVPLTEAQALAANPYINDPARQALWLAAIRFTERYHDIQPSERGRSHD